MHKQYDWEHGPIINGGESIPVVHYMCRKEIIENINVCTLNVQNSQKWQRMQSQILQSESGRIIQRFGNEQVNCMCTDSVWVQRG